MIVRPIEQRDHDSWRSLFTAYGAFYKTAFDDQTLDGVWAWLMSPDHVLEALVAEHDGAVIGIAQYRAVPDTFTAGTEWYLDDLFVAPAVRGSGAATALLERLKAIAAETHGTLRWITAVDNLTAQSVYDKVATRTSWVTYEVRS